MTTAQVVETSVTVNDNSPIQDYVNPDDQTQPTFEMTPGFKPFTTMLTVRFYDEVANLLEHSLTIDQSGRVLKTLLDFLF